MALQSQIHNLIYLVRTLVSAWKGVFMPVHVCAAKRTPGNGLLRRVRL